MGAGGRWLNRLVFVVEAIDRGHQQVPSPASRMARQNSICSLLYRSGVANPMLIRVRAGLTGNTKLINKSVQLDR